MNMEERFYEADRKAYRTVAPIITKLFSQYSATTQIQETYDGCRIDILMTATTTNNEKYYNIEVKDRQSGYTFSKFWAMEEAYLNKDEWELTKEEKTLGAGILIKEGKIKALNNHPEGRTALYAVNFPDNVIAFWVIDEFTKYGEIELFFDKYNVNRGEKELQQLYTLSLHNATYIYRYE